MDTCDVPGEALCFGPMRDHVRASHGAGSTRELSPNGFERCPWALALETYELDVCSLAVPVASQLSCALHALLRAWRRWRCGVCYCELRQF